MVVKRRKEIFLHGRVRKDWIRDDEIGGPRAMS